MDRETTIFLESRFEKLRKLHQTAKGEVWLAATPAGKLVIWKIIRLTGLPYAALKKISHPLLPEVLYVAEDEEKTMVIEEYVQGQPLSDLTGRNKFLQEREVRSILLQLCGGLALLHRNGIIHRDIKPSNILRQKDGTVRLIDFDAARKVREGGEEDTNLLGTRGYAPPEQFGYGQTDARSDIYSLGVTMKKLLSPEPRGYLHSVLDKCTEVDAKRRYDSVESLARAVRYGACLRNLRRLSAVLLFLLVLTFHLPQQEVPSQQEAILPEEAQPNAPSSSEEPEDEKKAFPAQKPEKPLGNETPVEKPSEGAPPEETPQAVLNSTPAPALEQPASEPSDNSVYMSVFWNGQKIMAGSNAFGVPINNRGKILHIPKAVWQNWGQDPYHFPADWNMTVSVENASVHAWENPRLELQYSSQGQVEETVLEGGTLSPGQEMEFSVPLGRYTVEKPCSSVERRFRLSGDGSQEVFDSTFHVSFDLEP